MKKIKTIIILIGIVIPLLFCFGCGTNNGNNGNTEPNPEAATITDYYPIRENTRYIYEGMGNEYASYNIYPDYTTETKIQQRVDNGGTVVARVLEIKDGKLTKLFSRGEIYYRENFLEATGEDTEILLMEPLQEGTTWTLSDGRVRTITNAAAEVTTPLGNYQALEVTTKNPNNSDTEEKTLDYYVKDIGLVKSVFLSGETEISSSLSKVEENVSSAQSINFYYPNIDDEKFYYQRKEISFQTNDITREILAEAYKEPLGSNAGKVFSENTKINSLYLNSDGMVYIDLNQAFLTEMNAGSMYESMILQSIANTFGQYYNAEKVILTIDGQLYESGHIALQKGESLKVNYENAVEIQ